ncbi:MAG: ATP-binding cassette domain-containing protein, partial [Verrucomicrobiota bacterium]|nr:ATP-binding cassette domain-containing protein [Verrucomicrobiota bacterium]
TPESHSSTISFTFPQPARSGQRVATLENIRQAYGEHIVYEDLSLKVEKFQRTVLVGPNGAGKSTLLKIIAELVPIQSGRRKLGHNVNVGYFSQQRVEILDLEQTVFEEAAERSYGVSEQSIRGILGAFLFRGDDVFKKVKVLSGGEKSRLALVKLLLSPPNLLLLDEPTTHLDMTSIDALIQALKDYKGTLIFVSHDVHFIRSLAKTTIQIQAGKAIYYAGDYDYYLRKSGANSQQHGLIAGLKNVRPKEGITSQCNKKVMSAKDRRRIAAENRKRIQSERRKLEHSATKLEAAILELEAEQKLVSDQLCNPEIYENSAAVKELNIKARHVAKYLGEKNYEWELIVEKLNDL